MTNTARSPLLCHVQRRPQRPYRRGSCCCCGTIKFYRLCSCRNRLGEIYGAHKRSIKSIAVVSLSLPRIIKVYKIKKWQPLSPRQQWVLICSHWLLPLALREINEQQHSFTLHWATNWSSLFTKDMNDSGQEHTATHQHCLTPNCYYLVGGSDKTHIHPRHMSSSCCGYHPGTDF